MEACIKGKIESPNGNFIKKVSRELIDCLTGADRLQETFSKSKVDQIIKKFPES